MKFGIFYEHQIGRPWEDDTDVRLIHDALEQIELADQLGIQYAWEVEHHFLEEYSHSSAPEVFLAAASQRTSRIRLGHGIVLTAPQFNHPARVAERIAMLDLVSNGRVEFGSGESGSEAELGGFGVPTLRKRDAWLEGLETAIRCMVETPFTGVDGEFVSMPPRNVVPKPVQKPHPPLWVACSRRETILLAARKGIGALTFAFIDPEEARHWVTDYERTLIEECVPVGFDVNPQVACVTPMMLHDDEGEAIRRGAEGANFFGYSLGHYYVFGTHRPGVTNVWQEYQERRGAQGYDPEAVARAIEEERLGAKVAAGDTTGLRGCTGTPQQAREYLRRYEEAGVDQVIFVLQAGRTRHEHIMEAIELFGREVLPEFEERDAAAAETKRQRLAPHVEAALARKQTTTVDIGDYAFDALPKQWADATHDDALNGQLAKFADDRAAGRRDPALGILG
jgi:alkanesulfonate monooxygenase SsuD/methylene tetrahydromethanopterin reductase-like flavin-dependent oxidoreductase (luciferase family)